MTVNVEHETRFKVSQTHWVYRSKTGEPLCSHEANTADTATNPEEHSCAESYR